MSNKLIMNNDRALCASTVLELSRLKSGLTEQHESGLGNRLNNFMAFLADQNFSDQAVNDSLNLVSELLANRAKLLDDFKKYPEIDREIIKRPFIVTGMPRSGTTIMQALLAADPACRAPEYWEVIRPSPPIGVSDSESIRLRIEVSDAEVEPMCLKQPNILKIHPYFDKLGRQIMECEGLGMLDLHTIWFLYFYQLPALMSINMVMEDPVAYFSFHRKLLKHLQWRMPSKRWALKGTEHHVYLDALFNVYPDAVVIWMHRDPSKVMASLLEGMSCWFEGCFGVSPDKPAIGRQILAMYKGMIDSAMNNPLCESENVNHILYSDFHRDHFATVKSLYQKSDIPFDTGTEAAMRDWMSDPENEGLRHGKFEYALSDFGLTADEINEEFKDYRAKFNIPCE